MTTSNYLNELTISYSRKLFSNTSVVNSQFAADLAREIYASCNSFIDLREYFFILMLNRSNKVVGYTKISEGGISGTVVDLRLSFATALKSLASGIILVHNHPSGNLKPSAEDIELTKKFRNAGQLLDIAVLDHLILTTEGYYSFADEGH